MTVAAPNAAFALQMEDCKWKAKESPNKFKLKVKCKANDGGG